MCSPLSTQGLRVILHAGFADNKVLPRGRRDAWKWKWKKSEGERAARALEMCFSAMMHNSDSKEGQRGVGYYTGWMHKGDPVRGQWVSHSGIAALHVTFRCRYKDVISSCFLKEQFAVLTWVQQEEGHNSTMRKDDSTPDANEHIATECHITSTVMLHFKSPPFSSNSPCALLDFQFSFVFVHPVLWLVGW